MAGLSKQQIAIRKAAAKCAGMDDKAFAALPDEEKQKFIEQASAEKPAVEKTVADADEAEDDGLIEMLSGNDSLRVHPSCVEAHKGAGWKVA